MNGGVSYVPDQSCQIPGLAGIFEDKFGLRTDGTFVEVGAFDGQTYSNTAFLADVGWRGLYVEPVPRYAQACAGRHAKNRGVQVINCAIGEIETTINLHVGGALTTADDSMLRAYRQIDWAMPFHKGKTMQVQQFRLEKVLLQTQVPKKFELLVVDVEGREEGVFKSFDLSAWRPRMMIVEIEDGHPSFQQFPEITARSRALRRRIESAGYQEIFRDPINTIFWDRA